MSDQSANGAKDGRIVAIAGPVVDIEFPPNALPEINDAVTMSVDLEGRTLVITAEVAQHIGESRVRAVALKPTDGLRRGAAVKNTGHPISVPVGPGVLGQRCLHRAVLLLSRTSERRRYGVRLRRAAVDRAGAERRSAGVR